MIIIVLVLLGLILGSFVNALVWRFHKQAELAEKPAKKPKKADLTAEQLSMLKGRSMCSNCHHELAPKDLVPLFSWLLLRGKCRYCGAKIQDSPLVEVVLPILFVLSYISWPYALSGEGLYLLILWLVFLVAFMALTAYDLRWYLLPDRIVYPLIGLAILEQLGRLVFFHGDWVFVAGEVWGVLIASGLFYLIYLVSGGEWIGGGDVKLGIVLGLLVSGPLRSILLLFIASMVGTLVALPLLLTGKADRTSKLPFGPYLMLAAFVVVVYGTPITDAYNRLFGLS